MTANAFQRSKNNIQNETGQVDQNDFEMINGDNFQLSFLMTLQVAIYIPHDLKFKTGCLINILSIMLKQLKHI